jgi:long-chain acyl-CoA synthetase
MNITHGLRRALQVNPQGIAILEGERKSSWTDVGERVSRFRRRAATAWRGKGRQGRGSMLNSGRYP